MKTFFCDFLIKISEFLSIFFKILKCLHLSFFDGQTQVLHECKIIRNYTELSCKVYENYMTNRIDWSHKKISAVIVDSIVIFV